MTLRTKRVSRTTTFMALARILGNRSTCARRAVGCILTNKDGHVLATGYNGVPKGWDHCISKNCAGASSPSGTDLDKCQAIHAEQNALLQCSNTQDIHIAYCTASPCIHCIKLLLNTSCEIIVFDEEYPSSEAKMLWVKASRKWVHINNTILSGVR